MEKWFLLEEAERLNNMMQDTILVETSPEDIHACCKRNLTARGMTSHAAVVARGMGRPCVSGSMK